MTAPFQPDPTGAITRQVAAFVHATSWQDIPSSVRHEAKRSILNGFATALGGARDPAPLADALWRLDQSADAGRLMALARPL